MISNDDLISKNAIRALLYEVSVTPKPGLVDPYDQGPHPDMTVYTFIDSAVSLQSYFEQCVQLGQSFRETDLTQLFDQIRSVGLKAESIMFTATQGVNTHKGAIFSLGILAAAVAYQRKHTQYTVQQIIRQMLVHLTQNDFKDLADKPKEALTAGERLYLEYHITGIRGEAEQGYPTVFQYALPALKRSQGTINQRLLDTLMTIVANSVDTNLIKRSHDKQIVAWAHSEAQQYLALGGCKTSAGMDKLLALNHQFKQQNLSLGGSADLLILTIFLGFELKII